MHQPQVDVIMGVYEPDQVLLQAAIDSILSQTYRNLRLIICDDGSQDFIGDWLAAVTAGDSRVLFLRHTHNRGLAAALNTCLAHTTGDYVARQDADDYSLPERLEKQVCYLEEHTDIAFAGSFLHLIDAKGIWGFKQYPVFPQREDFLFCSPFTHGALLFRRRALLDCAGYRVRRSTRRTEDYELLMRMYAAGCRGANLPEPLYAFREDEAAVSRRRYRYRLDEAVIRWEGFSRMGILPRGLPYVVKPLVVGLIPVRLLRRLKERHYQLLITQR